MHASFGISMSFGINHVLVSGLIAIRFGTENARKVA
jgi:hypothetical protein